MENIHYIKKQYKQNLGKKFLLYWINVLTKNWPVLHLKALLPNHFLGLHMGFPNNKTRVSDINIFR